MKEVRKLPTVEKRLVVVALPNTVLPVAVRLVIFPVVEYMLVAVKPDDEAVVRVVCSEAVNLVTVVVAKVVVPITLAIPETDRLVVEARPSTV
jgi:hypothetical protein